MTRPRKALCQRKIDPIIQVLQKHKMRRNINAFVQNSIDTLENTAGQRTREHYEKFAYLFDVHETATHSQANDMVDSFDMDKMIGVFQSIEPRLQADLTRQWEKYIFNEMNYKSRALCGSTVNNETLKRMKSEFFEEMTDRWRKELFIAALKEVTK